MLDIPLIDTVLDVVKVQQKELHIVKNECFERPTIPWTFDYNGLHVTHVVSQWFQHIDTVTYLHNIFVNQPICIPQDKPRIGIINRKHNRILLNASEIQNIIEVTFDIKVDLIYFEDKDFDTQVQFNYNHDIIISPHGAQLASLVFMPINGFVIEIGHSEWLPYSYFSGLSVTSGKHHAIVCNDHPFPEWQLVKQKQQKLNMTGEVRKIISLIRHYITSQYKKTYKPSVIYLR